MMKADPRRRDRAAYPFHIGMRALYSDMDVFRHLNNGAIGRYLEEGRAAFNSEMFGLSTFTSPAEGEAVLLVKVTTEFLREGRYPGQVEIGIGIGHIGGSSFLLAQAGFQNGECFVLSESVMVKSSQGRPLPLAQEQKARMGAYLCAFAS
ncbi:MAG: acyl-CoA thioesterase [Sphingobium sp.]